MIAHVVLFRPKDDVTESERSGLAAAFLDAAKAIDAIRQVRVGRRITHGRGYEQLMTTDYPYAAILEFDDVAGLKAYLEHPVHANLAARFFAVLEEALMYDYDLGDASRVTQLKEEA